MALLVVCSCEGCKNLIPDWAVTAEPLHAPTAEQLRSPQQQQRHGALRKPQHQARQEEGTALPPVLFLDV